MVGTAIRAFSVSILCALLFSLFSVGVLGNQGKLHPNLANAASGIIEVIVEYTEDGALDEGRLEEYGCETGHILNIVHGIAADCPADRLNDIADEEYVRYVWEDELLEFALEQSVPLINATLVWQQFGNGTGINVSILDTGINVSHPALASKVILQKDFTPEGILDDRCNHGTAVACAVGCLNDDAPAGVAPGAGLFNAKVGRVLNENPLQCGASASDIIAAVEWSIENHAQVLQMSIGAPSECSQSILANAVNRSGKNITIVVGSGNNGPGNGSVTSPGCAENALTVGASDGNSIASFSGRGPSSLGIPKPDLVAPGVSITAAHNSGISTSDYTGTSFSGPHVAGVVALMLQHRRLRPEEVKNITKDTAYDLGFQEHEQGGGRVDAFAAVQATLNVLPTFILNVSELFRSTAANASPAVINATIRNEGNSHVNSTIARVLLPSGVQLLSAENISLGDIPGLEQRKTGWLVQASASGNYTITILAEATGAAPANRTEVIELLVPAPVLATSVQLPQTNARGRLIVLNATVTNTGLDALNATATLRVPPAVYLFDAPTKQLGTLAQNASVNVNWTVNAFNASNYTANITANASNAAPNITFFTIAVNASIVITMNFQPEGSPTFFGYINDSGRTYGSRNGLTYGWNANNTNTTRDRNASGSADQRYDTLNHMQKPSNPNASWDIGLPSGSYRVRLVSGDPNYTDSNYKIRVEGALTINNIPNSTVRWFEGNKTVNVSDGKLTVSNALGSSNNKVNFIDILSA